MIFLFAVFGAALAWLLLNGETPQPALRWLLVAACVGGMIWSGYLTQRSIGLAREARVNARAQQSRHDEQIDRIRRQIEAENRLAGSR